MVKKGLKWYDWVVSFLVAIALINWPVLDLFGFNIVEWITFGVTWLATVIYLIVGIVGLFMLFRWIGKLL